jgi:hypothetical protein
MTGAARLVAAAGRRAGAGLATIAAPESSLAIYRASDPGVIVQPMADWNALLADKRRNVAVIGPGLGVGVETARLVLTALAAGKACVLDADALTTFASDPTALWKTEGTKVLTPHDGDGVGRCDPAQRTRHRDRIAGRPSRHYRRCAADSGDGRQRRRAGGTHRWLAGAGNARFRSLLRWRLDAWRGGARLRRGIDRRGSDRRLI